MVSKRKTSKTKDHPSLDIVNSHGIELSGKKIILCIAGSVAAYKAIELARLLMRHGADVNCVASNAVTKLVQPDYFKWATGNKVITKLTGDLEHIRLADYNQSDLIIVYPGTANTLGKLANGIDDTPVSTVLTVGFGSKIWNF
ncbi:MAG: flavoprotein, partial [Nitrosopumilaceae archaeon]